MAAATDIDMEVLPILRKHRTSMPWMPPVMTDEEAQLFRASGESNVKDNREPINVYD